MRIRRPAASGPRLASHTPESDGGRILAVIHSAVADLALQEQDAAQAVSTKRRLVVILYSTVPRSVGPIPVGTAVEPRRIVELILGNADSIAA